MNKTLIESTNLTKTQLDTLEYLYQDIEPYLDISKSSIDLPYSLSLFLNSSYCFLALPQIIEDKSFLQLVEQASLCKIQVPYTYHILPSSIAPKILQKEHSEELSSVILNQAMFTFDNITSDTTISYQLLSPSITEEDFISKERTLHLPTPLPVLYLDTPDTTKSGYISSLLTSKHNSTVTQYKLHSRLFLSTVSNALKRLEANHRYTHVEFSTENFPTLNKNFFSTDKDKNPIFAGLSKLGYLTKNKGTFRLSLHPIIREKVLKTNGYLSPIHPQLVQLTLKRRSITYIRFLLLLLFPSNCTNRGSNEGTCTITLSNLLDLLELHHTDLTKIANTLDDIIAYFYSISLLNKPTEILEKLNNNGWQLPKITPLMIKNRDFISLRFFTNNPTAIVTPTQQEQVYIDFT